MRASRWCRPPPREQPEVVLRLAELRALGGDPEIRRGRELHPAAETVTVDGGDDRLVRLFELAERLLALPREFDRGDRVCAAGRHALHVGARGERAVAGSGEQDRPHIVVVGVEAVDGVGKLVE